MCTGNPKFKNEIQTLDVPCLMFKRLVSVIHPSILDTKVEHLIHVG